MMLMPGFQIYLRPSVTLTFDLLTPKVGNCFVSLRVPWASKSVHSFWKYRVRKFGNWRTNELTNEQIEIFAVLLVGANFYMRPEYLTIAISDLKFNFPPLIVPR